MITVERVKVLLDKVSGEEAARSDARVARNLAPRYVEHGEPCCLVAVILHEAGFTVPQLRQLDTEPGKVAGGVVFSRSRHPLLRRIDSEAKVLLDYLQQYQYRGDGAWSRLADRALQRGEFAPDAGRRSPYHHDNVAGLWAYEVFPWNRPRDEGGHETTLST